MILHVTSNYFSQLQSNVLQRQCNDHQNCLHLQGLELDLVLGKPDSHIAVPRFKGLLCPLSRLRGSTGFPQLRRYCVDKVSCLHFYIILFLAATWQLPCCFGLRIFWPNPVSENSIHLRASFICEHFQLRKYNLQFHCVRKFVEFIDSLRASLRWKGINEYYKIVL